MRHYKGIHISRILAIAVVNYTCRPCMESTKKLVENIPVERSIGGRNTDSHTRGCSWPLFPSFQWTILGYSWNFWAICDQLSMGFFTFKFFTSLTFCLFEHLCNCCCNENPCYFCAFCEICGLLGTLYFSSLIFLLYLFGVFHS